MLLIKTAIQAWAQAVEQAGSLAVDAVSNAPRAGAFDTVYCHIGFDDKGELWRSPLSSAAHGPDHPLEEPKRRERADRIGR